VTLSQGIIWGIPGDALGYFPVLLTLGSVVLFGIRRLWRLHPGMQGVLTYLGLSLVLYGFLYYGQWRYRIPMEPLMILVATPLLLAVWTRRRDLRGVLQAIGGNRRGTGARPDRARPRRAG
jgi:hypothetical protein